MEKELEKLKAENEALRREQDLMFLLLEVTLTAVEQWGKENGLIRSEEDANQNIPDGDNQIGVLLNQVGNFSKEVTRDRFFALFEALKQGK